MAEGKELLTLEELGTIEQMHTALFSHASATKALRSPGINEASFLADCPITGLSLKCRPDRLLDSGWIVDLKTTQDASAKAFAKSTANFGYHIQAAFYMHVLKALGAKPKGFLVVAIEKTAPYAVQVFRISPSALAHGEQEMLTQLMALRECYDTYSSDTPWPAYPETVQDLELPLWATRP
jgi:hypothetical protein